MWCIVGLGNPGSRYRWTRHNVGFLVVEEICEEAGLSLSHRGKELLWARGEWCQKEVLLAQPQTFMNRSGRAVLALLDQGCELSHMVVVHDDMDLPLGRLKFKGRGGDAGHKGVRSILEALGHDNFLRLRVGIGRPPSGVDPVDYVLEPLEGEERERMEEVVSKAVRALELLLAKGLDEAMRVVHGHPQTQGRQRERTVVG
jgi:PTH1 family peptidyl-tRNA hydrolase